MGLIDYGRFTRIMKRCGEIAAEPGMHKSVVRVYDEVLKGGATAYLAADGGVTAAESSFAKENKEASIALDGLDAPYRVARSTTAAFVTGIQLPDTLKAQRTDTDKMSAIEGLLDMLDHHAGEPWADELVQGEFGQKAATTIKEIGEAIAANKGLSEARETRAAAYGPAYERYLRFKRVVRDALGAKSKQYKRIHIREGSGNGAEDGGDGQAGTATPNTGAPAQAGTPPATPGTPPATAGTP